MLKDYGGVHVEPVFNDRVFVGRGNTQLVSPTYIKLMVGIRGLSRSSGRSVFSIFKHDEPAKVSDSSFIECLVTLGHEYGHYLQDCGPDFDIYDSVSGLSAVGNLGYYRDAWRFMPCEIDAESVGVGLAWDFMSGVFPESADSCMLSYVNRMARHPNYVLSNSGPEFASRSDVVDAFAKAKADSLYNPRPAKPFSQFRSDMVYRLLVPDVNNLARSPYLAFYDKLTDRMPGAEKDEMMAALVLHVQPDWQYARKEMMAVDLSIEHKFGMPFPETTEASRNRLGISGPVNWFVDSFDSVERSAGQVPPSRDTSDLDSAVESITRRDAGPGPDYDIS